MFAILRHLEFRVDCFSSDGVVGQLENRHAVGFFAEEHNAVPCRGDRITDRMPLVVKIDCLERFVFNTWINDHQVVVQGHPFFIPGRIFGMRFPNQYLPVQLRFERKGAAALTRDTTAFAFPVAGEPAPR